MEYRLVYYPSCKSLKFDYYPSKMTRIVPVLVVLWVEYCLVYYPSCIGPQFDYYSVARSSPLATPGPHILESSWMSSHCSGDWWMCCVCGDYPEISSALCLLPWAGPYPGREERWQGGQESVQMDKNIQVIDLLQTILCNNNHNLKEAIIKAIFRRLISKFRENRHNSFFYIWLTVQNLL